MLPFELDFPQREFRGSLLKVKEEEEQEEEKETGSSQNMSLLNKAYIQYDLSYAKRNKADQLKKEYRLLADKAEPDERVAALVTACCICSKITYEKIFDIQKAIGFNKKKKNQEKKKKKISDKKKVSKAKEKKGKDKKDKKEKQNTAYGGAYHLINKTKKNFDKSKVNGWLSGQDAYNSHKQVKKNFPRRTYNVSNIYDCFEGDLADFRSITSFNDGYA